MKTKKQWKPMFDKRFVDMTDEELVLHFPGVRDHASMMMQIDGMNMRKFASRQASYAFKMFDIMYAVMKKRNII